MNNALISQTSQKEGLAKEGTDDERKEKKEDDLINGGFFTVQKPERNKRKWICLSCPCEQERGNHRSNTETEEEKGPFCVRIIFFFFFLKQCNDVDVDEEGLGKGRIEEWSFRGGRGGVCGLSQLVFWSSQGLLSRGQTLRVLSHLVMQWLWKGWLQVPQAILQPSLLFSVWHSRQSSVRELRQMAHFSMAMSYCQYATAFHFLISKRTLSAPLEDDDEEEDEDETVVAIVARVFSF